MISTTGTYKIVPDFKIKIQLEDRQLVAVAPDGSRLSLFAESEKDFYLKGQYLFVHFKKDEKGKVTGFQMEQFNGQQFVEKIN